MIRVEALGDLVLLRPDRADRRNALTHPLIEKLTHRTILNWVQAFGPQLAAAVRQHRRPVGRCWTVDEVFLFRKGHKLYLYRAIDEEGVVIDVLLREHRDTASAQAFFRQASSAPG